MACRGADRALTSLGVDQGRLGVGVGQALGGVLVLQVLTVKCKLVPQSICTALPVPHCLTRRVNCRCKSVSRQ